MFEKGDSSKWSNRQYKWKIAHFSKLYGKIRVGFYHNTGKRFFLEAAFWKTIGFKNNGTRDFQDKYNGEYKMELSQRTEFC